MSRTVMGPASHYAVLVKMIHAHGDSDECLLWPYSRDKDGYGVVQFEEKANRTHKVAFRVVYGHWAGPCTLHSCDNPPCFNPSHLYAGTQTDNARDRINRGQQARGERQGLVQLTDELVLAIRSEYQWRKVGCQQLATRYGVCPATIYQVITRKTWTHI